MFLTEEENKEEELEIEEEDEENREETEEQGELEKFSENEAKELLTTMGLSEGEVDQWVQDMKKGEIGPFPVFTVDDDEVEKSLPKLDLERPFEGVGGTLDKLTELVDSIRKLESGLILNLTEWIREIKEKILSLKQEITTQFIERLKLRMFKKFIEKSYEDAVISSFEPVETETLSEYINRLGKIFREYKEDITVTEEVLRKTIVEQEKLMREHVALLRKKEQKLRDEIKLLESKTGSTEEVIGLRADLSKLEEENKGLKMRMQDLENIKTNLQEELGKLKGTGDAVEEQVVKLRELDEKLGELRISKSRLEEELNRTKIDLDESNRLLDAAETEIENLKSELVTLRPKATEELESMRKKIEEMQKLEEENKGLKMRMQDLENSKKNLQEELGKLKGTGEAIQEQVAKMRELDEKLGELRISKSQLEEELNRTKIDLDKKSKLLETADNEIENLKSELVTLRPKATEELESMKQKIEEMKAKEKETWAETKELRQKVSALEKELSEKEEMMGEIGEFAAKEEDYKRRLIELDDLKEKIKAQRKAISTMRIVVKDEPKFKILFACQDVGDRGLNEEEIKKSLGVPLPLVQRYIKELMDLELLKEEKGRYHAMI